jgi:hypothetical protein
MSVNQNQKSLEEKLKEEDKNPPKPHTNEEQEPSNLIEQQEKMYLEGEPHLDPNSINNENDNNVPPPIETKKQIITKPRENYLKEKLIKMNNQSLLNNVQKGLGTQVENVKSQIKDSSVIVTETPKDLNKKLINSENKIVRHSNEYYVNKKKYKTIKELKNEQNMLTNKLRQIEENEALLNNEGFINVSKSCQDTKIYDKNLKDQQMKGMKNRKMEINERLKEIDYKINQLMSKEENNETKRKENLQSFKDNFERDKEIIEARAKKYLQESQERSKRLANDIEQIVEKRKKEIEEKEKKDEKLKDEIRKKFISEIKKKEQNRLQEGKNMMIKYKPHLKEKPQKKEDLYDVLEKKYQETEQKLLDQINREKKAKNKSITSNELEEFWEEIEKKKEELREKKEKKNKKEQEKFEKAKNYKPSYVSHFTEMASEEYNKLLEKEQTKREEIHGLKELKINYAEKVRKKQPEVDEKLKKERMDKIIAIDNPKLVQVKDTLVNRNKNKRKRILLKKRDPSKPSKYKYKLKLEEENPQSLNNSMTLQNHLVKKPVKINFSASYSNKERTIPDKKIDYLKEIAEQRKQNTEEKSKDKESEHRSENRQVQWNKKINSKSGGIVENIYNVKKEADILEKKAEREQELLKYSGGIESNPEIGKKMTGYLISSIEAKLSILNKIYE